MANVNNLDAYLNACDGDPVAASELWKLHKGEAADTSQLPAAIRTMVENMSQMPGMNPEMMGQMMKPYIEAQLKGNGSGKSSSAPAPAPQADYSQQQQQQPDAFSQNAALEAAVAAAMRTNEELELKKRQKREQELMEAAKAEAESVDAPFKQSRMNQAYEDPMMPSGMPAVPTMPKPEELAKLVCKNWVRGSCVNGANCPLKHPSALMSGMKLADPNNLQQYVSSSKAKLEKPKPVPPPEPEPEVQTSKKKGKKKEQPKIKISMPAMDDIDFDGGEFDGTAGFSFDGMGQPAYDPNPWAPANMAAGLMDPSGFSMQAQLPPPPGAPMMQPPPVAPTVMPEPMWTPLPFQEEKPARKVDAKAVNAVSAIMNNVQAAADRQAVDEQILKFQATGPTLPNLDSTWQEINDFKPEPMAPPKQPPSQPPSQPQAVPPLFDASPRPPPKQNRAPALLLGAGPLNPGGNLIAVAPPKPTPAPQQNLMPPPPPLVQEPAPSQQQSMPPPPPPEPSGERVFPEIPEIKETKPGALGKIALAGPQGREKKAPPKGGVIAMAFENLSEEKKTKRKQGLESAFESRESQAQEVFRMEEKVRIMKELQYYTEDQYTNNKLYIGGIPRGTTEQQIKSECYKYGMVTSVYYQETLTADRRNWAFVTFGSADMAGDAVRQMKNQLNLFGSNVKCEIRYASQEELDNPSLKRLLMDKQAEERAKKSSEVHGAPAKVFKESARSPSPRKEKPREEKTRRRDRSPSPKESAQRKKSRRTDSRDPSPRQFRERKEPDREEKARGSSPRRTRDRRRDSSPEPEKPKKKSRMGFDQRGADATKSDDKPAGALGHRPPADIESLGEKPRLVAVRGIWAHYIVSTGQSYYHNIMTGATAYDKPQDFEQAPHQTTSRRPGDIVTGQVSNQYIGGKPGEPGVGLFVYHLPMHWGNLELHTHFAPFGTLLRADVQRGPDGISRGFGFVTYATHEEAKLAIGTMDGYHIMGKKLSVSIKISSMEGRAKHAGISTGGR